MVTYTPNAQLEQAAMSSIESIVTNLGLFGLVLLGMIAIMFMIVRRNLVQEQVNQHAIKANAQMVVKAFNELSTVREELNTERTARNIEASANREVIKRFEEQVRSALAQRDIAKEERARVEAERDKVLVELASLNLRVDDLSKQIEALRDARKADADTIRVLTQERDDAMKRVAAFESENNKLRDKIQHLDDQYQRILMIVEAQANTKQFSRADIMNQLNEQPITPLEKQPTDNTINEKDSA